MHEVELVNRVSEVVKGAYPEGPLATLDHNDVRAIVMITLDVLKVRVLPDGQINTAEHPPNDAQWLAWLETPAGKDWHAKKVVEAEAWAKGQIAAMKTTKTKAKKRK